MTASTNLYINISKEQWPIVYRKEYNVNFMGLEKLHPFDAHKWNNVYKFLNEEGLVNEKTVVVPKEASKEDLLMVHSKKYLKKLNCSVYVAKIAEVVALIFVPNVLVQRAYLKPMRFQTGGSILAGKLALDRGWAINIGGGFHHCCATKGGGFCAYADITLLIKSLFFHFPNKKKINDSKIILPSVIHNANNQILVDLDAHQGNGYQRDFKNNPAVYIMDVYNKWIYPWDSEAKAAIRKKVELDFFITDDFYLRTVKKCLVEALAEFEPQILVYNAGTDILKGDKLGGLAVTAKGIIKRDELVFREATSRGIPIVMLTSGGYLKRTARIIADSITHLYREGLIHGPQEHYF
ncbi:hypothetical protein NQ315_007707 [Exocentrus adspersus]|uniref:Histone deacetylase 11 n=1 Tax=Exocentrus adspersus TaxID=1586481 RepID=A0AAV8W7P2_9CUCU|nr:hypothetical protein NQ315_007707 [Exocentrus adspersus]